MISNLILMTASYFTICNDMKQDQFFVQLHLVATDLLDDSFEQKHHLQLQNSSPWISDRVCLSVSAGYSPLSLCSVWLQKI